MTDIISRSGSISLAPFRIAFGLLGLFITIYFIGGLIATALDTGIGWQNSLHVAGAATGAAFIIAALFGTNPRVLHAAGWSMIAGVLVAAVALIPAFLILSRFFGGITPHVSIALYVLPLSYLAGMLVGAAISWRKSARRYIDQNHE